jgi:predicted acyl esterase
VTVVIDLWATSVLFRPGHRIRLDVSSSNFPRFDANPNTGEAFADRRLPPIVAQNTIHLGAAHTSFVSLPVRSVDDA